MIVLQEATALRFDPPEVRENVDIVIEGQEIREVGPGAGARYPEARVIPLRGALVSPGLVCAHHHFYSALARGLLARIRPSNDFVSILRHLWWRLDRAIDREILEASARVAAMESIRAGVTAVIDHHASPSLISGSLRALKHGFDASGLRGVLCYEVTDRNGEEGAERGVEENLLFALEVDAEREGGMVPRVEAMIGGHAPFTLSDRTLRRLADAVERTGRGFHVHAAEDAYDVSHSHDLFDRDPLERLAAFGLLTPRTIVAHGVHLPQADLERLNESGAFLAHNCRSNMNNRVGHARGLEAVRHVAVGTDGMGGDLLEELRFAWFRYRESGGEGGAQDLVRFLQNGNELLERQFGARFGRLESGYRADLVVWNYFCPTPLVEENLAGHILYGLAGRDARTVIVDGRIVYEDGSFPFDPEPVYGAGRQAARRLWQRMDDLDGGQA